MLIGHDHIELLCRSYRQLTLTCYREGRPTVGGSLWHRQSPVEMWPWRLCCVCVYVCVWLCDAVPQPQVTVDQGVLSGMLLRSRGGRQFSAFEGIPYAKPPVDKLRFQKPQPAGKWEGILNATKPSSRCLQSENMIDNRASVVGSEDCLYLNVYTHKPSNESKYPVLVFIHGGGFVEGSGAIYRPDFLMDKDIVFVTLNYRLGPLGFLSLEDKVLPGNNGLKDQTEALRWVKDNIAQFGGDPGSVTISGESAGAASVHYHTLSPLSRGLFHRAIAHSGSAYCPWATHTPGQLRATAERYAAHLGCNHFSSQQILDCINDLPPYVIVSVANDLQEWNMDPVVVFTPAIEPEGMEGAFITKDPWSLSSDIPLIMGFNSAEGSIKAFMLDKKHLIDLNDDFELRAPLTLLFRESADDPVRVALVIKKHYFLDSDIKPDDQEALVKMYSDSWFTYPILEALYKHSGPKYLYYFDYRGVNSVIPHYSGVSHFDEMQYFHPLNEWFPKNFNESTPEDLAISNSMIEMWTNFITYGKPTIETSKVVWNQSTSTEYLHIGKEDFSMKENVIKESYEFWHSLPYREKYINVNIVNKKEEL